MRAPSGTPATFILQFEELQVADEAAVGCGTKTLTMTREEQDQDRDAHWSLVCGTGTFTRTKEEPDQDPAMADYLAIPRA